MINGKLLQWQATSWWSSQFQSTTTFMRITESLLRCRGTSVLIMLNYSHGRHHSAPYSLFQHVCFIVVLEFLDQHLNRKSEWIVYVVPDRAYALYSRYITGTWPRLFQFGLVTHDFSNRRKGRRVAPICHRLPSGISCIFHHNDALLLTNHANFYHTIHEHFF